MTVLSDAPQLTYCTADPHQPVGPGRPPVLCLYFWGADAAARAARCHQQTASGWPLAETTAGRVWRVCVPAAAGTPVGEVR